MHVGFINQNVSPRLNIGLAYIMTMAAQKYQVYFWDIVGRYKNFSAYLKKQIRKADPCVIGFSVNSYTFRSALRWAEMIKKEFLGVTTIFGGVYPTISPEECIQNPAVDAICIGEGEYTILEYLDSLEEGKEPYGIKGIWFKDKKGQIVKNPLRPFVEDLDSLPWPDWDIWDIELYIKYGGLVRNSLKVLASRGCNYNCRFCTAPVIKKSVPGNYYRLRSAANVIAEIKHNFSKYHSLGFRYLSFADPLFGANSRQFNDFVNLYEKEGLNLLLPWICETRTEIVTSTWAKRASEAGCIVVSLGIESGDRKMRETILGKETKKEMIIAAISNLKNNGILYILYFIVGAPGETVGSFNATVRLAAELDPIKAYFLFFLPLPKTPLFEECKSLLRRRDCPYDDGFWDRPNIKLNMNKMEEAIMQLRLIFIKITFFLRRGWQLRKLLFFADILGYIKGKGRVLPLSNPYAVNELYQNTVLKYFLEGKSTNVKCIQNDV